ncbi:MAG: N-acetylmuramoyl-L-alanine amidase [Clostridiales bacterium]|nr:N-acetylmuramoyl-L-alanine amidase [Clostridiales bacterium]
MKKPWFILFFFLIIISAACSPAPPPVESPTPAPSPTPAQAFVPDVTPRSTPVATLPTPKPGALSGISIGIDPGHQSRSDRQQEAIAPGAQETRNRMSVGTAGVLMGAREYDITLNIARHLQRMLTASGARVVMTRDDNHVNLSNAQRALILSAEDLDFAVSLHCEGSNDPMQRGSFAIISADVEDNEALAQVLLSVYAEQSGFAMWDDPIIKQRDNPFLNWATVPAVWLNMGCLSNPDDESALSDIYMQEYIAYAIYIALVSMYSS